MLSFVPLCALMGGHQLLKTVVHEKTLEIKAVFLLQ